MRRLPAIFAITFFVAAFSFAAAAQEEPGWEVQALNKILSGAPVGNVTVDMTSGTAHGTNGVFVRYGSTTLTADNASVNLQTGEAVADGHVQIEQGGQIWLGEHITYNFKTRQMRSEQFRTGQSPVFAQGGELTGDISNKVYNARHVLVTTDDIHHPAVYVRASRVKIVPGQSVEAWNAVLFVRGVPSFYFPYYKRNLNAQANNLNFLAGYRSAYGPFLLSTYSLYLDDVADGKLHLDYREKRGVGAGPDLDLHLGRWGEASLKYYYLHDRDANAGTNSLPNFGSMPENRQRFYFAYQAAPATNLDLKALVNYQSDPLVLHDFFEGEYAQNPQPNSFVEANRYGDNWSLDALATPRINDFFDTVERLPDVKLTGYRQQIFDTPVYYESESSAGYYRKMFADTNNPALPDYSAARADTFHQLLLPWTFFNWLNVTPNAGGRFTYYSHETGPAGTNDETYRGIFNAGVNVSFKASRLWKGATNSLLEIDGLRHIIEPSAAYVFVPHPTTPPPQLPQFDSRLPSLEPLPIQFPDDNDIDSIDSRNVIRFGLRNTLQTKRDGQLDDLLDWNVMLDWNLAPNGRTNAIFLQPQKTFNDLYSDLAFKPRSWITLDSQARYDINSGHVNLAVGQLELTPNDRWSWGLGYWYLRQQFLGEADNLITSTMFFRLNDNWGLRATHDFNAQDGRLQEQFYTLYRDLRNWTGALTFRVIDNGAGQLRDYTVAFTFSLKANPRYHLGDDTVQPYRLIGE